MKKSLITLFTTTLCLTFLFGCSNSGDTTAGTGVGNPGKTTISFVTRSITQNDLTDSFTVFTADGLQLTIKSAYITAKEIYFKYEGGSLLKKGPFQFNAFNGESEPKINFDNLPNHTYTGIDFIVETEEDNNNTYSVELYGTFLYNSKLNNFSMKLNIKGNAKDKYDLEDGPAKLNFNSENIFKIDLEIDGWLNNIHLKDYLDNKILNLEPNGDLIIDENSDWKAAKEIAKDIKKNIFKSGKLYLIQQ